MGPLVTACRLALAAVFAVAAVGKLRDRPAVAAAAEGLGVARTWSAPVAIALPVVEGAVAVSLLVGATAVTGAAVALFLLVVFTVLVARNVARGRRPPCLCFGQSSGSPMGPGTVVRNLLLMAPAIVVVLGHGA
jgi:uncharacterized membrane protein YphA (DoxX/SURF4 family)